MYFKYLKENNCQPRLLYPAKVSFQIKGEIKNFQDNHNLKKFTTTIPATQKVLKRVLHSEEEDKYNHKSIGTKKLCYKRR
jgi:hypothetical protein